MQDSRRRKRNTTTKTKVERAAKKEVKIKSKKNSYNDILINRQQEKENVEKIIQ